MKNADMVLQNGKIYTIDTDENIVEALAIEAGKIIFVGSNAEVKEYIGENTEVIDLAGNVVLPGFIDTHVHVPGNAYNVLYNINLFDTKTERETIDTIRDFIKKHPEREIYYGRGFMSAVFGGIESAIGPRKERLDEICPDKPVIIVDFGGHAVWLNSKALEKFNITKDTPDIPGGIIEKDPETGELWGVLKEEAKCLYSDPEYTLEEQVSAVKWLQDLYNGLGYTTIFALRPSASSYPSPLFEAMAEIEASGELNLRICGGREIKVGMPEDPQIEELVEFGNKYRNGLIRATTAKFFMDGTVEGVSAYLSEPYTLEAGKGSNYTSEPIWEQDRLTKCFIKILRNGFNIHVHAIGDEAVSKTIDAMEVAQREVPGDHRNTITHIQLIKDRDIKRMQELDLTACVNVFWHFKDPCMYFQAELPFLGEKRADREYPLKRLVKNGIRITSASDHPCTPYPNPFFAIEAGVTRNLYNATFFKVEDIKDMDDHAWLLGREERVSVMDMVKAYTINSAYSLHMEQEIGSIEVGKYADIIVIDRDIFNINPIDIEFTKVLLTIFNGAVVKKA